MEGQEGATQPFTPVAYSDQKKAMETLSKYVFAPDAWQAPEELYNYLALQRRGFNFFGGPEDPKIHATSIGNTKKCFKSLAALQYHATSCGF